MSKTEQTEAQRQEQARKQARKTALRDNLKKRKAQMRELGKATDKELSLRQTAIKQQKPTSGEKE